MEHQIVERWLSRLTDREKLELIERLAASAAEREAPATHDQRHQALRELRAKLRKLPVAKPDGWSSRDHDRLLYGGRA